MVSAQPQMMNYQGVARGYDGQPLSDKNITLRIHLLSDEVGGPIVYTEIHRVRTGGQGSFSLRIGGGEVVFGRFSAISWARHNHFIKIEMDPDGGTRFTDMGTTQLLSVPYAFHAQTAGSLLFDPDAPGDPAKNNSNNPNNQGNSSASPGIPSQTWSLFGNRGTDHVKDKLGTTDNTDLVIVTNNEERMRILSNGNIVIAKSLDIGGNLRIRGDSVIIDKNLYVADTTFTRSLYVKDNVPDEGKGGYVATFENANADKGDGIAIRINREQTTDENNFVTFFRRDKVAGRIEGFHHRLGDKPVFVAEVVEPMLSNLGSFFTSTLGFKTPISLNYNFINFSGGSLPKLDIWFGPPPGYDWDMGSLPSLSFSSPIKFNTGVTELIQPWTWFSPNWSEFSTNPNSPVYKVFEEAIKNDWKTLLNMGITDLAIKVAAMELEAVMKSGGVTYGSKGADYAEWLPRAREEDRFGIGQVVGVHGGHISLNTAGADHIMVISSTPIVLGNMPDEGQEHLFEKVAFLGQVPTWVIGQVKVGDYILASDRNDGFGVAVSPAAIRLEDMERIVGKAWSASTNELFSLINVAVGLNRNDLRGFVSAQQDRLEALESRLEALEERLHGSPGVLTEVR